MEETRVGFALTGSFCTLDNALRAMEETAASYPNILPILSEMTAAGGRKPFASGRRPPAAAGP